MQNSFQICVFTACESFATMEMENKSIERRTNIAMIRRTKGMKRYAKQREKRFTDPLIREDELARVKEARDRLSTRRYSSDYEDKEKYDIEGKYPR